MTAQEIQALINAKIAGQGSAVDVGGALPQILSGILELAQAGAGSVKALNIPGYVGNQILADTKEDFCERLGITVAEFDALLQGEYAMIYFTNMDNNRYPKSYIPWYNNGVISLVNFYGNDIDNVEAIVFHNMNYENEFSIMAY